jgi:DNA replication protein DnaC
MQAVGQVIPGITTFLGAESASELSPRRFSDKRKLDVPPVVCPECRTRCTYERRPIGISADDPEQGFYWYERTPCKCELAVIKAQRDVDQAADERKLREQLLRDSRVDAAPKTRRMCLKSLRKERGNADAVETVKEWLRTWAQGKKPARGLMFFGPWGVGKTHLAIGIVRDLTGRLVRAEYWNMPDLLESLRPREDALGRDIADFIRVPVLAIDDIGKEKLTDWGAEQLYRIINARDLGELPTIATSNFSPDVLAGRVDGAVVSRLVGMCEWVEVQGEDHRSMPNWQDVD